MNRLLAIFGLWLVSSGAARAAPHGVRLSYFDDPSTTVGVGWNSDEPADDTIVYGTSAASLTMTAKAARMAQAAPLRNAFVARLTGLSPGTTYFYRVGGAGGAYRPASSVSPFQFTTLSGNPCAPLRFILIGDNRQDIGTDSNPVWAEILTETLPHAPQFFVNTGDMVKNGHVAEEWASFIDASESGWALIPSILTMGNHDDDDIDGDGALYNQLYELPRNPVTGTEDYYSIDIGPIHFVSLNTQHSGPSELNPMTAWLQSDLAATTKPWKIVFFHKSLYSRGHHSTGEDDSAALNKAFVPVLDATDVDFALSGHSHNYERFAPSVGLDSAFGGSGRTFPAGSGAQVVALPTLPDGKTGTTYIVSGGAGALTTEIGPFECIDAACTFCTGFNVNCDGAVLDKDKEGNAVYEGRHNFAIFDVNSGIVRVEVWATASGNIGDAEVVDTFTMSDPTFECSSMPSPDAGVAPTAPDSGHGFDQPHDGHGPSGCGCRIGSGRFRPLLSLVLVLALLVGWRVVSRPRRPA